MMNEAVRIRLIERHGSAAIRALSNTPKAEYRRQTLFIEGRGVPFNVPHLYADTVNDPIARNRGATDAISMRLVHCDKDIYQNTVPDSGIPLLIFDILEQLRCESLVDPIFTGLIGNLNLAFDHWCSKCRSNGLVENELGLLIYSLTHIVRSHLTGKSMNYEIEGLTESVRFQLAPVIGKELSKIKTNRHNQQAYAEYALAIANKITKIVNASGIGLTENRLAALRSRKLLPPVITKPDEAPGFGQAEQQVHDILDIGSGYKVFCTDFDRTVQGKNLCRMGQQHQLRSRLDQMIRAQSISIPRLAHRLKLLFGVPHRSGWHEGEEDGYIDGRRLSQLVANTSYTRIFKREKQSPESETVLSFLIDNSGSMKRQKFEAVTVLTDILCRALDFSGIKTEILGYTTGGWAGGESIKVWRNSGSPENPGRLNDRFHVIYKDADTSWRQARYSIATMLNPTHFREGLDGEALQWAADRLLIRPEPLKCLVMISDGAPMETATGNHNGTLYLDEHLKGVAHAIQHYGEIQLRAIGIDLDMGQYVRDWGALDLKSTLDNSAFNVLESLYGGRRRLAGSYRN